MSNDDDKPTKTTITPAPLFDVNDVNEKDQQRVPVLRFELARNEDPVEFLTCWLCGSPRVLDGRMGTGALPEYVMKVRRGGETSWLGVHAACARRNGAVAPDRDMGLLR